MSLPSDWQIRRFCRGFANPRRAEAVFTQPLLGTAENGTYFAKRLMNHASSDRVLAIVANTLLKGPIIL